MASLSHVVVVAAVLLAVVVGVAAGARPPIHVANGMGVPLHTPPRRTWFSAWSDDGDEMDQYWVTFADGCGDARAAVERVAGRPLGAFASGGHWTLVASGAVAAAVRRVEGVEAVTRVHAAHKVHGSVLRHAGVSLAEHVRASGAPCGPLLETEPRAWVPTRASVQRDGSGLMLVTDSAPRREPAGDDTLRVRAVWEWEEETQRGAARLARALARDARVSLTVARVSRQHAEWTVRRADVYEAALSLAAHVRVHAVHVAPELYLQNEFVQPLVQSGLHNNTAAARTVWAHGVRGEGHVVGLGDTGIDADSCFFSDANHTVHYDGSLHPEHRKIVMYLPGTDGDNMDVENGHGTHAAGILAGALQTVDSTGDAYLARFAGMAPEAKIAFVDLARGVTNAVTVPADLAEHYFDPARDAGARVHCNAWSSESPLYDGLAVAVDQYVWEHPEFLPVFAVGNNGLYGEISSVGSPSTAKNALSVGASMSSTEGIADANVADGYYVINLVVEGDEAANLTTTFTSVRAAFGQELTEDLSFEAWTPAQANGCESYGNEFLGHRVVVVERGDCDFVEKATFAAGAQAPAVIVINSFSPFGASLFIMGPAQPAPDTVTVLISYEDGQRLRAAMARGVVTISFRRENIEPIPLHPLWNEDSLAEFTSLGPTDDMRRKPDVVAPGKKVVSARSDGVPNSNQCGAVENEAGYALLGSEGTSASTAVVSAAAVLVRDYFAQGFYPSGAANAADAMNVMASTVKAVLVHSGRALTRMDRSGRGVWEDVWPVPSNAQGYGRVVLDDALYFADTDESEYRLWVHEGTISNAERLTFCFDVTSVNSTADFRVTLVWTDPAGSTNAYFATVNNLDLHVRAPNSETQMGNMYLAEDSTGARNPVADTLNNVEQVTMANTVGTYFVDVFATDVTGSASQPFSLVVSGNIVESTCINPIVDALCPADCSNQGECVNGKCQCNAQRAGLTCAYDVLQVQSRETVLTMRVPSNTFKYIQLALPSSSSNSYTLTFRLQNTAAIGVVVQDELDGAPDFQHTVAVGHCSSSESTACSLPNVRKSHIIGVYGACCGAEPRVTVAITETASSSTSSKVIAPAIVGTMLFILIIMIMGYMRRTRDEIDTHGGVVGGPREPEVPQNASIFIGTPVHTSPAATAQAHAWDTADEPQTAIPVAAGHVVGSVVPVMGVPVEMGVVHEDTAQ